MVFSKINKTISLLWKLQCLIQRSTFLTIYKTFVRPYLDNGDNIYEKPFIKSAQYKHMPSNHRSNKRYFKRKAYDKVGIGSLQLCYWFRNLCYFYKFYKNESSHYLFKLIPLRYSFCTTRNVEKHTPFQNKFFLKNLFFPQLLLSGTALNITFEKSEFLVFLKTIY